ncbi:MAG: hypothetical protein K6F84_01720, partial [Lachnospiraceae bacterium]|nr:hypothetical protein [Lachnospiraceae bacterium]
TDKSSVVVKANGIHKDNNNDGKCDGCGNAIDSTGRLMTESTLSSDASSTSTGTGKRSPKTGENGGLFKWFWYLFGFAGIALVVFRLNEPIQENK